MSLLWYWFIGGMEIDDHWTSEVRRKAARANSEKTKEFSSFYRNTMFIRWI